MNTEPPPADSFYFIGLLAASAVLLTLSMLFSISESSFLAMNKLRLRALRQKKDKRALRAGKLLDRKDVLINTLLAANDLVNILLSSIITAACLKIFGESGVAYATFGATILLLIFGEITPKTLSTRHPDSIAYALSGFVTFVVTIMRPVSAVFTVAARGILALFGVSTKKPSRTYTEEEIKTFIDAGSEEGILEKGEDTMMNRVFKFTDLEAQDIMVPRTRITAVPYTATYRQILEKAQRTRLSRFPVYKKNIDDIAGIIYMKDFLQYKCSGAPQFKMQDVLRPPLFILGTKKMSSVMQMLRENRQSLAIVIDEYSGTDGLLTQEDITREIFGTSGKGRKGHAQTGNICNIDDFVISGGVLLLDLKSILHIPLESEINETLGGWIAEKLDRMPETGDTVAFRGYRFTVKNMQQRRAVSVHVQSLHPSHEDDTEEEE